MNDNSVLQAFASACAVLHSPDPASRAQAEARLLEFRVHASLEAFQQILQQLGDEAAAFQAILGLRDAVLSRWPALGHEERQAALGFLLRYIMERLAGDPQRLLRAQATGAAAAIIKRGWEESSPEEREAALQAVHAAAAARPGSLEAQRASLELLSVVVLEFSPATASAMGLSWEIHEHCRASLEAGYLRGLLRHALASARAAAPAAAAGADGGACRAALGLLSAILQWNFSRTGGSGVWLDAGRPASERSHLRPPAAWAEELLAPGAWDWLGQLAEGVCQPASMATPLARAVRDVVVQLCGLDGDVFGPLDNAGQRAELGLAPVASLRLQHLQTVLRMVLPWVTPPPAALALARQAGEEQLQDGCRGLLAAAGVHRAAGFEAAGAALGLTPQSGGLLALLAELAAAVEAAAGPADAWGFEAFAADLLLDMWIELVGAAPGCGGQRGASEAAARGATSVFGCIVDARLQQAAAEALEDDEEAEGGEELQAEEGLARIAVLGRAAAAASLELLVGKLQACLAALQQRLQAGSDLSVALEQLCWLVAMSGHLLADDSEGETPLVPLPVALACEAAGAGGAVDPAAALSRGLLAAGSHCLAQAGQAGASPRLLEVVAATLARWADTYLMSGEAAACSPALAAAYGPGAPAARDAAHQLLSLALAALTACSGERALHEVACSRLLAALVRRREVCAALRDAPAWHQLCGAVGGGDAGLLLLAGRVQRRLLQSLLLAAAGWPAAAGSWAAQLLESTAGQLRALGGNERVARAAVQRADGLHLVLSLLERLRGAFKSAAPALLSLLGTCGVQPAAVSLVLKLACDVVEHQGAFLAPADAAALCVWSLQLLQLYSAQNLGRISISASKAGAEEALSEKCAGLTALLRLLTKLTQTDWGQLSGGALAPAAAAAGAAEHPGGVDVAQVVFAGLDIVVPLLDQELLKFPKLCRAYFALLAHMLEVYTERMAALPPPVFQRLLSTLRFGVGMTGDDEVTQARLPAVFEAAAALARHHVQSAAAGGPGLGANNAPGARRALPPRASPDGITPLGALLQAALHRLIHADAGLEAVDHASEAVLPLALADPAALQRAGAALLAGCANGPAKTSAEAALHALAAQVGAAASLDRPARKAFGSALHQCMQDLRGAARVR
eukprot:scaffold13.g308.t1